MHVLPAGAAARCGRAPCSALSESCRVSQLTGRCQALRLQRHRPGATVTVAWVLQLWQPRCYWYLRGLSSRGDAHHLALRKAQTSSGPIPIWDHQILVDCC